MMQGGTAVTVGVAGLGTMGLGIAQVFVMAGHPVIATDAKADVRAGAAGRLAAALDRRVAAGRLTVSERDGALARLTVADDIRGLAPAAVVIEAIVERLDAKRALIADLDHVLAADAVLATNTSALSVAACAGGSLHPGRVIGCHFFNPAPAMRLVELVGTPMTHPAALALARRLCEGAGKTVIDAPDRPGFIVNRVARPVYGEALALLEEDRAPGEIDAAMQAAGYALGPFGLIDLIGADVNLAATEGLAEAMQGHPRYHVFAALRAQVAAGYLGRKSGRGFVHPDALPKPPADADTIVQRIEATLINEAGWLLAEGGTTEAGIDTAMRLGLNLPRGPFEVLASRGEPHVREVLCALAATAPPYLRGRYDPSPILRCAA